MGSHDIYGKALLESVAGDAYVSFGPPVEVEYGAGLPARIDGAVDNCIAVEIESRTSKQVRGAVLDLIVHNYKKKLLILLPVHMSNPKIAAEQCCFALSKFIKDDDFRVVVLAGHGNNPRQKEDREIVKTALTELGFTKNA